MNIINTSDIEQVKNQIKDSKKNPIIVNAQNDNFNRKILEYGKFDILFFSSNFLKQKKDGLRQIDSGFNHILGKIASKNKIAIGFDLNDINQLEKKDKAIILSKIIQNIKICRKTKTKIAFINYKDKINLSNLLMSLGASTEQAIDPQPIATD